MSTSKFDLHTIDYSVQGWDAIMTTDMEKLDDVIHTRIIATAGETIAQYDAVYLESDGKYDKALADGSQQPAYGLALESAVLDDEIRIQRIGPITNAGWTWATIGSKVYLDPSTPGALTDVKPGADIQMVGTILSATSIFIWIDNMEGGGVSGGNVIGPAANNDEYIPQWNGADSKTLKNGFAKSTLIANPLTSQLNIAEYDIKLDSLLSADGKYSGLTCDGVLGATLAFGDLVYLNTTDQRWELADADAEATAISQLAIVLAGGDDGNTRLLLLQGYIREDDWNFTLYGKPLFISLTAGDMTQDISGYTTGKIGRVVGYASTIADQIYFNPSGTWIEI